ncbi:MAG: 2-polyprenyl-3-methyl-6-methoxy-1,4-benzoquinone monooxygenase [Gammaproteobacteria bacterium]|jgi:ubiquinone biosynthesis monooxygenase Coq7|nr:2-polyprenyl-3-methyl-6-methoxy-1,4-benzoquinone monooxygenase [Gammaproteobacteria bacterium]
MDGGARRYSTIDRLLIQADHALRTVFGRPQVSERANPATAHPLPALDEHEAHESARLMRINHAGEVSAQALYQGQAMTARLPEVRGQMERAAIEENDHLVWCAERIEELGGRTSLLNPLWYAGSFTIGAVAGLVGDRWSLGFIVETERQVIEHLEGHLSRLPAADHRSRAILEQMKEDEAHHGTTALNAGAAELPPPIKAAMRLTSRVMTGAAYYM